MRTLFALALLVVASPAAAQHPFSPAGSRYDARVPTPRSVIGHDVGERFTPHHAVLRYFERVAGASARVTLDTLGMSFEGREYITAVVTSERNHARLPQIKADAQRLADPRGLSDADAADVIARMPAIVLLTYTVHGNEASGTEAALATLYELAATSDAALLALLDSVVVLIDPIQNPDGHERHVQDVLRRRGAFGADPTPSSFATQSAWPGARTSHYHFDLNRDWFIQSHPESRARVGYFFQWWPHVVADLHEMGSNATYFFAPPMEPINKNVPASVLRWWETFASANAAAFDAYGWPYFRREGYDEFYPGYGISWPILSGAIGMTYEQASSGAGAVRRSDGTVLTLAQAARNHYTTSIATVQTAATRRLSRVTDYLADRRSAVSAPGPLRAVYLANEAGGRADSLVALLERNRIEMRLASGVAADAVAYPHTVGAAPASVYVVDLAQPQGRLAKALLEPDAELDSAFIAEEIVRRRTAQPSRFYDITAWSLPMSFGVRAWTSRTAPAARPPRMNARIAAGVMGGRGTHGYAFVPGSESALRLLASLFRDSIRVHYAPKPFRASSVDFPSGAFIVRTAANDARVHDVVAQAAVATGMTVIALRSALVESGTDLGSNSVVALTAPKVAMLAGAPVNGNSFGFAWYAFEQRLSYPVTAIDGPFIASGGLRDFTVLVIPSAGGVGAALGEGGLQRLQQWVRDGGALITLENATAWLASEASGLSRLRPRRVTPRDTTAGAPPSASVPGALLRAIGDSLSPLLAGVPAADLAVLVSGDRAFDVPRDVRPQEAVLRLAPRDRLRLSGYLWPESWDRQAGSVYLWSERQGRGRVTGFAGDPNYRDLSRALLPVFANAVFFGAY
jgi:hypothetical protein